MELAGVIFAAAALALYAYESREWRKERSRLLDRVMARNYNEFVHTTATVASESQPFLGTDEAEAAWHEENRKTHPEQYPDDQ